MGIMNMLLSLPAGKQMLALPSEQSAPLVDVMCQLREQADIKAAAARARGEESAVDYWRLVSGYAKHIVRAFKREHLRAEKSQLTSDMMRAMGVAPASPPIAFDRYVGAGAFRAPAMSQRKCVLEVTAGLFAPWVEAGNFITVDFTPTRLTGDGLYVVAVDGNYLAIRGFHKGSRGWYIHESADGRPRMAQMREDRLPAEFDIVGRITDVYKKDPLSGRQDAEQN